MCSSINEKSYNAFKCALDTITNRAKLEEIASLYSQYLDKGTCLYCTLCVRACVQLYYVCEDSILLKG